MRFAKIPFLVIVLLLFCSTAYAEVFTYGTGSPLIGAGRNYKVQDNESLIEIARKFDVGYNSIVNANPEFDPFVPAVDGEIKIPTEWALPEAETYDGIVINISEMRLYHFFARKGRKFVQTFPIGIGSEGNDTPLGKFSVVEKVVKPSWHVPDSIREERPELPRVVPPGPENPLGSHALRLSSHSIMIHGTNRPWAVGRRATHGCLRLYPEDIPKLFENVVAGAKVVITRQPVKVGLKNGKIYLEVHKDDEEKSENYMRIAVGALKRKNLLKDISTEKLYQVIRDKTGIPTDITE
ncbi:MAG: LysM peptidoglycan-binding domain-containing protein [Nitrospirae bacterium]|nr:MAG: LysM peptidoglycan-binding domain-containing protein [Nitrospirota bacterium]